MILTPSNKQQESKQKSQGIHGLNDLYNICWNGVCQVLEQPNLQIKNTAKNANLRHLASLIQLILNGNGKLTRMHQSIIDELCEHQVDLNMRIA